MINLGKLYEFEGWDPSYEVIFLGAWSDYEESGWVAVMHRNGRYYEQHGGYCVMAEDNTDYWDPYPVSEDQAIETMIEWHEHDQTDCLFYHDHSGDIG